MKAKNNLIPSWNLVYFLDDWIYNSIPKNYTIEELDNPIIINFTALENINIWNFIYIDPEKLTAKNAFWEIWNNIPAMAYINIPINSKVQYITDLFKNKQWFKIII